MGGSFALVQVAGFTWNGWQTSAEYADKGKALHLLSVRVVESGLVIYQRPSEGKKNEIRTVQQLLDILELKGACLILNAMHCQRTTVKHLEVTLRGNYQAAQTEPGV